jgi:predicted AAA+ superfamily ATPase
MNLIFIPTVIDHLTELCRTLKLEKGHALMIGEAGLGISSIVRLSCHILNLNLISLVKVSKEKSWID